MLRQKWHLGKWYYGEVLRKAVIKEAHFMAFWLTKSMCPLYFQYPKKALDPNGIYISKCQAKIRHISLSLDNFGILSVVVCVQLSPDSTRLDSGAWKNYSKFFLTQIFDIIIFIFSKSATLKILRFNFVF